MITVKYKFQVVLLFLMILSSVSCETPPITNNRIQTIERGMDHERFKSMIFREPTSTLALRHEGLSYYIEIYPMQTGITTVSSGTYSEKYGMSFSSSAHPAGADYFFIFDKDGLIFWGFLNELHKEDDKLIQQLAPLISERYERGKLQR